MLPSNAEVAQALRGSWRLIDGGEKALSELDLTVSGLFKSYGALLLTLPALVALLAAQRLKAGLINESGLFDAPLIALQVLVLNVLTFFVVPAMVLALMWGVARTARGTTFVIAWNWAEAIVTLILAVPAALFAIGWAPTELALMFTAGFAVLAARLRYAVARTALAASAPAAVGIVALTFAVELFAGWAFAIGRF
jgi:hypothetical protein